MFELIKLAWDFVALRDATRNGEMTARVWLSAIAFVLMLYGFSAAVREHGYTGNCSSPSSPRN
jgi:hypothetical protein